MAHYAFINEENMVTEVITGVDETEPTPEGFNSWEEYYGSLRNQRCLRTSYNANIRGIMAGIGHYYNEQQDIFEAIGNNPYLNPEWTEDDING